MGDVVALSVVLLVLLFCCDAAAAAAAAAEDIATVDADNAVVVGFLAALELRLLPPGLGVFPSSLHSGQLRMTSLTVSLILLQWYRSAMVAVVLLIPAC